MATRLFLREVDGTQVIFILDPTTKRANRYIVNCSVDGLPTWQYGTIKSCGSFGYEVNELTPLKKWADIDPRSVNANTAPYIKEFLQELANNC